MSEQILNQKERIKKPNTLNQTLAKQSRITPGVNSKYGNTFFSSQKCLSKRRKNRAVQQVTAIKNTKRVMQLWIYRRQKLFSAQKTSKCTFYNNTDLFEMIHIQDPDKALHVDTKTFQIINKHFRCCNPIHTRMHHSKIQYT